MKKLESVTTADRVHKNGALGPHSNLAKTRSLPHPSKLKETMRLQNHCPSGCSIELSGLPPNPPPTRRYFPSGNHHWRGSPPSAPQPQPPRMLAGRQFHYYFFYNRHKFTTQFSYITNQPIPLTQCKPQYSEKLFTKSGPHI